jgi:hypothetical protein
MPGRVLPVSVQSTAAVQDREELPAMRRDTVELVKKAVTDNRQASVLVNNRSEGNAPLTVQALVDALRG